MKTYGLDGMKYILVQPISIGLDFISIAGEEEAKEKIFQMYLVEYQYMDKTNFKTFDEYYLLRTAPVKNTDKTDDEIIAEFLEIEGVEV